MEISANEHTIESVLSGSYRMKVPEYQRQYAWTEEQWTAIWDDLLAINEGETHFLGSIVMIADKSDPVGLDIYSIVDGQQRLVTISIILAVMRWRYEAEDQDELVDSINNYLWQEDLEPNTHQNITLGRFDNGPFRELLDGDIPSNEQHQMKKAADYFTDRIYSLNFDEMDSVRKRLLQSMKVVLIDCENESSAFKLFETLNDRGLELSAIDLMKNHLFKTASARDDVEYEAVRDDWESIIESVQYTLMKPRRFFLHYILSSNTPDIRKGITGNMLYDEFKDIVDNKIPESHLTLGEYMSDMVDAADVYVDIVEADIDMFDQSANEQINRLLDDLDKLGYTQERTLLLRLFRELDSPSRLRRILRMVETFIVRRRLTDAITGKEVNAFHASICSNAFSEHDIVGYIRSQLSDESPEDELVETAMANENFTMSNRTLFFLKRFESEHFRGDGSTEFISGEIEHIAPRRAFSAKKYSSWETYLGVSKEEFETVKDKIGNLTHLSSRMNARAQDNPFEQKKSEYGGSEYRMSEQIAEKADWTVNDIEERTEELASVAPKIWDYNY